MICKIKQIIEPNLVVASFHIGAFLRRADNFAGDGIENNGSAEVIIAGMADHIGIPRQALDAEDRPFIVLSGLTDTILISFFRRRNTEFDGAGNGLLLGHGAKRFAVADTIWELLEL